MSGFDGYDAYGGTQGYYQCRGSRMPIAAAPTTSHCMAFSHPLNLYGLNFFATADNVGDTVDVLVNPDAALGVLVAPAVAGDTSVSVSDTVAQFVRVGFGVALHDDASGSYGGATGTGTVNAQVAGITPASADGSVPASLLLERPLPAGTSLAAGTTVVRLRLHLVDNLPIDAPGKYTLAYLTDANKVLPAGTSIGIEYTNANGAAKTFSIFYEFTY
jgi:hypothetical protein